MRAGMLQTIADDIWGRPCLAYHVQPDLGAEARTSLAALQQRVAVYWPDPLHLCPVDALHVTIYALVPVEGDFDKEGYWRSIAEPCRVLLDDLCRGHGPLELRYFRLKVTDAAIIAVARDETGLIEAIRRQIAEHIPPPPGLKPLRYDLIHSTLARYRVSTPVPEATIGRIESLPVSIPAPVERIKIISETLFPCQNTSELASFPLCPTS
jgi:hypothetical protein